MKIDIVKIDETGFWNEDFRKKYGITKLMGVYLYDSELGVRVCEITPSRELNFVHTQPDYGDDLTEEQREEMWEEINEADCQSEPVTYMHCGSVQRHAPMPLGEFEDMDEALEYCQANWQ